MFLITIGADGSRSGREQEGLRAGLRLLGREPPGPPVPSDTTSAVFFCPSLKLQSPWLS